MFKRFSLYITLFWSLNGFAQPYISVRGDFSVDQRRGCRDLFVTVTNINPGTDVILYQFEGRGTLPTANNTFTYTTTGNYWLYQYIQGPTGEKADSLYIEIFDPEIVDFELESCNNNDLLVTINNTTYDLYEIDYGDGAIIQVPVFGFPPSHHYNTAGPFNVTVSGLYTTANNQCGTNSSSYTPVNIVQPGFINILEVLDNTAIVIDYTLAPFTSSTLEISLNDNSSFQTIRNLPQGSSRDTLDGLNLNNTYCFRIVSNDACSNFETYSNEICSTNLGLKPVNDAMEISWQAYFLANFDVLNIIREGNIINSLAPPPASFNDSTVVCNTAYCYQLEVLNMDGAISRSSIICDEAFSTTQPETVTNVSSSIEEISILWTWEVPENQSINNFRINNDQGEFVTNTADSSYVQERIGPINCLQWEFTNICGNTSTKSRLFCPLSLDYAISSNGSTLLNWNNYEGWANGVTGYALLIYDQSMSLVDSLWLNSNTSYEDPLPTDDNQVSYYRVIASPIDARLAPSRSNILIVERPPVISLPSSFTPNNDGLNDIFEITGKYLESQELTIFNRWGSILFTSKTGGWDGTVAGEKVGSGTYIYQAKIKDFTGKEHIRTGSVLILKD